MTKRSSTARSYPVRIPRVAVGPLASTVLGECSAWSAAQGYSPGSAAGIGNLVGRLSAWMQEVGAGVDDIDEDLLAEFVAAELSRELPCVAVKRWGGTMRRFLKSAGHFGVAGVEADQLTPVQAAAEDWRLWMRERRGLTEKTVAAYCHYAAGLLDVLTPPKGRCSGTGSTRPSSTPSSPTAAALTVSWLVLTSSARSAACLGGH